jgi:hypothetical protein
MPMTHHRRFPPLLRETRNTNMAGGWNLKFTFCFMDTNLWTVTRRTRQIKFCTVKDHGHSNKFCLSELLDMTVVRNFEVLLQETRNHSVKNSLILCSVIPLQTIYLLVMKFDTAVFSWCDKGIIMKPHIRFIVFFYQRCFEYYRYQHRGQKILEVTGTGIYTFIYI